MQQTFSIFDTVKTKKSYQFFSFIKIYQICFDKRSNPEYNPPPHHALHAGTAWCLGPVGRIFAHTAFYRPSLQLGKSVKKGKLLLFCGCKYSNKDREIKCTRTQDSFIHSKISKYMGTHIKASK